jgi:hypothetical protein
MLMSIRQNRTGSLKRADTVSTFYVATYGFCVLARSGLPVNLVDMRICTFRPRMLDSLCFRMYVSGLCRTVLKINKKTKNMYLHALTLHLIGDQHRKLCINYEKSQKKYIISIIYKMYFFFWRGGGYFGINVFLLLCRIDALFNT